MHAFCAILGFLCLGYYLVLVLYAGITADFAWIWIAAALTFLGGGCVIRYERSHPGFFPGWLGWAAIVVLAAGCILFASICTSVIRGMSWKGSADLDYVVVLGAQVRGSTPSRALKKRLDKALEYARENERSILILSGGQGLGEEISEAECMRRYLTEHGISKGRLVLEDRSTTTRENLVFSDQLTGCGKTRTGILSNNFHIYRAVKLARKQGYQQAEGIAAPSDPVMQVHYVVREVFALVKEIIKGNI